MKKIPALFIRDRETGFVTPEIDPVNLWITEQPSVPYRKWNGTCVKYDGMGRWYARREVKKDQEIPRSFVIEDQDFNTLSMFGWIPIEHSSFYKYFLEAIDHPSYEYILNATEIGDYKEGTYELMGPRINNNPEGFEHHVLMRHAASPIIANFTMLDPHQYNYETVRETLSYIPIEGVVWYSPDGRRTKIKRKDFAHEGQIIREPREGMPMRSRHGFHW